MTLRHFIHRSIREHLVADYVAGLAVDEATEALLPHIWYDLDWEYSAPAALAMHPERDQLLRNLICRAAMSDQIPEDVSVIDARSEFRGFLARVAAESSEDDWSPDLADMIGQTRIALAQSARTGDLGGAEHWPTSNREVREALLRLLGDWDAERLEVGEAGRLVSGVVQLASTEADRRQARDALLELLSYETDDWMAEEMVNGVVQLATTEEDKRQTRDALLGLLGVMEGWAAEPLVSGVVQLARTTEGKRLARDALLVQLVGQTDAWVDAELLEGLLKLDPTEADKRQARDALLMLLVGQTDAWVAAELVEGLLKLDPTEADKHQARDIMLGILADQQAAELVNALLSLDPPANSGRSFPA